MHDHCGLDHGGEGRPVALATWARARCRATPHKRDRHPIRLLGIDFNGSWRRTRRVCVRRYSAIRTTDLVRINHAGLRQVLPQEEQSSPQAASWLEFELPCRRWLRDPTTAPNSSGS